MSYQSGSLIVDFDQQLVFVEAPQVTLTCQELINVIRNAEASEEGICFDQIATASGKEDLGGSVYVGLTVNLLEPCQVKFWPLAGVAKVAGGNLVGGIGGDPVAYTAGVQVLLIQSAAGTIVETGTSGLTPEESAQLNEIGAKTTDVYRSAFNRRRHDKDANTITLFDDDGLTPHTVFDANDELTEISPR